MQNPMKWLGVAAVAALAAGAAEVKVDFGRELGEVKPLHGVGQGPIYGMDFSGFKFLKDIGVPYTRLHDVGGAYGRNQFVDIPNVFRNFDADETDPANYDFAFTDKLLEAFVANGVEPYYRLGVTIENYYYLRRYTTNPPKDFAKWARICEHVIRHYTEGWAGGYKWNIRYWEIWNEPENTHRRETNQMWSGTFEDYCRLYEVSSKHLKKCFPNLKIGGYAGCGFYSISTYRKKLSKETQARFDYLTRCADVFLEYVRVHGCPLDFFSYHGYDDPEHLAKHFAYVRSRLDAYGFKNCEMHVNEWLPGGGVTGSAEQAAKIAATLVAMQQGGVDVSMVYDGRVGIGRYSPLFDPGGLIGGSLAKEIRLRKGYYALQAFNELYRLGRVVEATSDTAGVYALAARGQTPATGGQTPAALLVANTTASAVPLTIAADGRAVAECRLVDETHDYAKVSLPASLAAHSFALLRLK